MTLHPIGAIHPVDITRFGIWVEKSDGCWTWEGSTTTSGYGRWQLNGYNHMAHRIAWTIANGEIPEGMVIDHMCHNKVCVNPAHLRIATPKQNLEHIRTVRAKSGYRGVHRSGRRWVGCVVHNGAKHYTPNFDTPEGANEAVIELRNKLYTHNLLDRKDSPLTA